MIDRPRAIFPFYYNIRYLFTRNCYRGHIDGGGSSDGDGGSGDTSVGATKLEGGDTVDEKKRGYTRKTEQNARWCFH